MKVQWRIRLTGCCSQYQKISEVDFSQVQLSLLFPESWLPRATAVSEVFAGVFMPPCLPYILSEKTMFFLHLTQNNDRKKHNEGQQFTGQHYRISWNFPPRIQNAKGAEQRYLILLGEMTTNCQEQSQEKEFEGRMNIPQSKIAFYVT